MKAGEVFIATTGEYSDFGIANIAVALQDFDYDREFQQWIDSHQGRFWYDFHQNLRERGLVGDANVLQMHLGDCGYAEFRTPEADARARKGR